MNYQDELLLEINRIWQHLSDNGHHRAAHSIEVAIANAKNDMTALMAALDYARWHFANSSLVVEDA